MTTDNHIGKQFWVAAAVPATNDDTGFEALTWVRADGFLGGLQLGFESDNIDIPDLAAGITLGSKGMRSGSDSTAKFREITADAGQIALRTSAASATGVGSVKVISAAVDTAAATGDKVQYAQGYFHSLKENEISGDGYEGFEVNFKQNQPTVNATEPA